MIKRLFFLFLLLTAASRLCADGIDDIRQALEASSVSQVQEKVFVHTDNQCYFVGDTLWYKAYVVRADNLHPTDMSRLLYVELLSPDGLLVERQTVIISPKGFTCGQFVLTDSLYSGYYELRAYTRWMLNFNVRHHSYRVDDTWWFYNKQMAADYFRIWDGLYSRVMPVYAKPEENGDYDARRMYQRPKTRIPKQKKDDLVVTFYPEGGHLIKGVENRVAFEVTDQHGEAVQIAGTVKADGMADIPIRTEYMGRGSFLVTPADKRLKAHFSFKGKNYTESLPKAEEQGVAIRLDDGSLTIHAAGLPQNKEYALSILCRGKLQHFEKLSVLNSPLSILNSQFSTLNSQLPTGVNNLTIFDSDGQILADRLFFVNHHEMDDAVITSSIVPTHTYAPYEKVEVPVQLPAVDEPTIFSLSIRDTNTDEPTYDDGNVMTDLLLSSELKGFIARPAYYFEADDKLHRRHLDLLMMVQGWRKYKWEELCDTARQMRYQPETTLTIEGSVYKMLGLMEVLPDEVESWQNGVGVIGSRSPSEENYEDPFTDTEMTAEEQAYAAINSASDWSVETGYDYGDIGSANDFLGVNHGNLKREVLVEAEIYTEDGMVGAVQKTQDGHFIFEIPPFYGTTFLNMKAYKENDSIKKSMTSRRDKEVFREDAFADYYVKRDLFYPMYTHEYTFYEQHQPDYPDEMLIDTLSDLSMENDVHQLQNVNVSGHRRGRHAIDWTKPAYVRDAYDLYNDLTDYGLSYGKFDMRQFPLQVAHFLYGNMGRNKKIVVDARIDGTIYWRNYDLTGSFNKNSISGLGNDGVEMANIIKELNDIRKLSIRYLYEKLKLARLQNVRIYSDYEPRKEVPTVTEGEYVADMTVEMEPIADDGKQIVFRDRHIVFHGINAPVQFYQPDYSNRAVDGQPADYRRTLYWNPNAVTDENGRFVATFYNNGKETRIRMTAAGVTGDGRLLHSK